MASHRMYSVEEHTGLRQILLDTLGSINFQSHGLWFITDKPISKSTLIAAPNRKWFIGIVLSVLSQDYHITLLHPDLGCRTGVLTSECLLRNNANWS